MLEEAGGEDHETRRARGCLRGEEDSRLLATTQRVRVGGLNFAEEGVELACRNTLIPGFQGLIHGSRQTVEYVLEKVDMVLIMTVNPGFGGQKFIPYTLQKVRDLKKMIDARGLKTDIEVDGGVNLSNVEEIMSAGANIIVAGSAVFNGDVAENTQMFLDILNS